MKHNSDIASIAALSAPANSDHTYSENNLKQNVEKTLSKKTYSTILLITGNSEIKQLITSCLPDYTLIAITNNTQALQQALLQNPNLVLMDVYLPVTECHSFCRRLKENRQTGHVPILLVVKDHLLDASIEQLSSVADDFVFTPFSREELIFRIRKLVNGQTMFNRDNCKTPDDNIIDNTGNDQLKTLSDDPFLQQLYKTLEVQLNVSDFGVEDIANSLFMSRAKLHRKLTKLTGLAPGTIIKHYRLHRAVQFLKEGHNCKKTAYKTGFSSPAYFTKCFHEYYKITPANFLKHPLL